MSASRVPARKAVSNEKKNAAQCIGTSLLRPLTGLDERLAGLVTFWRKNEFFGPDQTTNARC